MTANNSGDRPARALAEMSSSPEQKLRDRMARARISSWRALGDRAGVSRGQIQKVRCGRAIELPLIAIDRLAKALGYSRTEFLAEFEDEPPETLTDTAIENAASPTACGPRTAQAIQPEALAQRFQAEALERIESFLIFWPVAADRARRDPSLSAQKLLPLLKPIEAMLADWGAIAIGEIGSITPFDPQQHQPIAGEIATGTPVRVTHCGYRHGERLLFRAKVRVLTEET